jgi:hypothetical protein
MAKSGRKPKDLVGKKIGLLTVIEKVDSAKNGEYIWRCLCKCGAYTNVLSGSLSNGNTSSCGCLRRERARYGKLLPTGVAASRQIYRKYRAGAKKRKLIFQLSEDKFVELCKGTCHYCGAEPTNPAGSGECNGKFISNGIDRVDNLFGYIESNCVTCCRTCNIAKFTMSKEKFLDWIARVYNYSRR